MCQVLINRLAEPYDECIDTSSGKHDFTRNVYEELYPETLYSLEVITYTARYFEGSIFRWFDISKARVRVRLG